MSILTQTARLALERALRAGISVAVDCQCDGIVIAGAQYFKGRFHPTTPTHVPAEILATIVEHAGEIERVLRQAGWWCCGCEEMERA
jgi:hypothetical protein